MKITDTRACSMTQEEAKADRLARRPEPGSSMEEKLMEALKKVTEERDDLRVRLNRVIDAENTYEERYRHQVSLRLRRMERRRDERH